MCNFIESCLQGNSLLEEIDDYIDAWHEGDSKLPLHAFLGMSQEEYAAWVENPDVLAFIVTAHRSNMHFKEVISQAAVMAARSDSVARASQIKDWLQQQFEV